MKTGVNSAQELFSVFQENAKDKKYLFSRDEAFVSELMNGLFENMQRYGYASCPCRLSTGIYSQDEDIICPCEYMESDVEKYGACFCALYVSQDVYDGKRGLSSIPESRPKERIFAKIMNIKHKENSKTAVWKCTLCGYEHEGNEPPEKCPKCGASKAMFVKKEEPAQTADLTNKWKCTLCGYEHEGNEPPEKCPKCGASKAMFSKL